MNPSISAALWILSGVSAGLYGFGLTARAPGRVKSATKIVALGALAVLMWLSGQGWLLALALTLCAIGELMLALPSQRGLTPGLLAFLLARAAFLVVFARIGGGVLMFRSEPVRLAGVLVAVSAAVLTMRSLWVRLGPMLGPVGVYTLAITGLAVAALTLPSTRWPAIAGAFAFAASDGVLAFQVFAGSRRWSSGWLIWWLYYIGLALIAWTFISPFSR